MNKQWYKKANTEKDKEEIKAQLVGAAPALQLLRVLLLDMKEAKEYNHRKQAEYDSPNWALKQADYIGSIRTLIEVIDLITIEE